MTPYCDNPGPTVCVTLMAVGVFWVLASVFLVPDYKPGSSTVFEAGMWTMGVATILALGVRLEGGWG